MFSQKVPLQRSRFDVLDQKYLYIPNEPSHEIMALFFFRKPSGDRCLIFDRTLPLLPYFMCANSKGSGETARMPMSLCDKYHNLMSCLKYQYCDTYSLWVIILMARADTKVDADGCTDRLQKMTCAPSKDSDQPSLIRVFTVAWRKLGSLATHWAQMPRLSSLRWVHMGANVIFLVLSCFGSYHAMLK